MEMSRGPHISPLGRRRFHGQGHQRGGRPFQAAGLFELPGNCTPPKLGFIALAAWKVRILLCTCQATHFPGRGRVCCEPNHFEAQRYARFPVDFVSPVTPVTTSRIPSESSLQKSSAFTSPRKRFESPNQWRCRNQRIDTKSARKMYYHLPPN